MDLAALLNPTVRDPESFREFVDALTDQLPEIERHIGELRATPEDRPLISALFRGIHTIKGDAAMCRVDLGVMIAHPIESLLARVRESEVEFSELVAELVLLALDRLELAIEALGDGRRLDALRLPELVGGLEGMGRVAPDQIDAQASRVIEAVTGFRPTAAARVAASAMARAPADSDGDLRFFRELALQFEARSALFAGRSERLLALALEANRCAGTPVDPRQLEAAVYLHDVGMMLLPEILWLGGERLEAADLARMQRHVEYSAGLAERMPGWSEAARIVRQHHERHDGKGYPAGLAGAEIAAGARILAIADAFEAVSLKQGQRGQRRSLLRAVAEINACDTQFDPAWIAHFNTVIRGTLEA